MAVGGLVQLETYYRLQATQGHPLSGEPAATEPGALQWDGDRAEMLTLPPVKPVSGWTTSLRLPRDHYDRFAAPTTWCTPARSGAA